MKYSYKTFLKRRNEPGWLLSSIASTGLTGVWVGEAVLEWGEKGRMRMGDCVLLGVKARFG